MRRLAASATARATGSGSTCPTSRSRRSWEIITVDTPGQVGTTGNDGETGEQDNVINAEHLIGGSAGDTITASNILSTLEGRRGNDTLTGGDAGNTLDGGFGSDTIVGGAAGDTIPLNKDDRPPELRLFDAFGKFKSCIADEGYTIEGDLQDPNNPAYKDPAYLDTVRTCAARTDIINILAEVQATRANLTPDEVKQRNEVFIGLRDCLENRGWTIETTTSEIGLLEPKVFQNADGVLDERDIDQCVSELNIGAG